MLIALRTSKIRENRFFKISSNTHLIYGYIGIYVIYNKNNIIKIQKFTIKERGR